MRQKSFDQVGRGALYLVPTPIGNLEDMTFRAVKTLQEVDLILAEDTRHSQKLLNHFQIQTPLMSFHEHNTQARLPQALDLLLAGQSLAQISDAGTPSISDPGYELVDLCIQHQIPVIPLPGANAAITALIASGLAPQPFYFYGFLGRKAKGRLEELTRLKGRKETSILYESPYRIKDLMQELDQVFGGDHPVVVCRELTKKHEEWYRGSISQVSQYFQEEDPRGEFCVLIGASQVQEGSLEEASLDLPLEDQVAYWMDSQGLGQNEAIKRVAKLNKVKKQEVYRLIHGDK